MLQADGRCVPRGPRLGLPSQPGGKSETDSIVREGDFERDGWPGGKLVASGFLGRCDMQWFATATGAVGGVVTC